MYNQLQSKIRLLWDKFVNRETITYAVAGVLTTLVNFCSYHFFCNILGIKNLVANAIAWVIAVIFAYMINNIWVFQSKSKGIRNEIEKITKFFGARICSFGIEEVGLYVFVDIFFWNNMLVKAGLAVIVIILNYIFSKLFIFNNKKEIKNNYN